MTEREVLLFLLETAERISDRFHWLEARGFEIDFVTDKRWKDLTAAILEARKIRDGENK